MKQRLQLNQPHLPFHLQDTYTLLFGSEMYGAFWCSHYNEQKTDQKVLNMQVLTLKDLSSQDSTGRFLCVLLEYGSVGIRKTKQNLYELEFIVDEAEDQRRSTYQACHQGVGYPQHGWQRHGN